MCEVRRYPAANQSQCCIRMPGVEGSTETVLAFVGQITTDNFTHQSSTAEQDHKNDEGFKPVVLHDDKAGLAKGPPSLAFGLGYVDSQTRPSLHTV